MSNSLSTLSRSLVLLLMLVAGHAWSSAAVASPAAGPCTVTTIRGNDHGAESIRTYDQWLFPSGFEESFRNGNASDRMTEVGFSGQCSGARVTLYRDTGYRGGSREFHGSDQDATYGMDGDWEGQVSSYRVSFPPMPAPVPDFTTAWARIEGNAVDVGAGADGSVWVIDDHSNQVYRYTGSTWQGMDGEGKRIDAGPNNDAYVVVVDGGVWYGDGTVGSWVPKPGHAVDIAAGANGFVWRIGLDSRIWRHNPAGGDYWIDMGGHGVRIDAGPNGDAYVVTDGSVWYCDGTVGNWIPMPKTRAIDISVGDDTRVWITHTDGGLRRLNETRTRWERTDGHARQISVGADGIPWVVQENAQIWTGTPQ
ncbi:MAG: hypothetical protein HN404_03855 [Gemmatimonadetes bacterium]|nr:hypothetical protein [Gemmatimonadota bacterium]